MFPQILLFLALFNLLAGNGAFMYLSMLAPIRRGWLDLIPYSLTVFGYWVLMSIASYKALSQLIRNPFFWEKTHHGVSKFSPPAFASDRGRTVTRALAATPIAGFAFMAALMLATLAVQHGFVSDDAVRLWARAATAGDGDVSDRPHRRDLSRASRSCRRCWSRWSRPTARRRRPWCRRG